MALLGLESVFFACLAQILCDYTGRARQRWTRVFRYDRAMAVSAGLLVVGGGAAGSLVFNYLNGGLVLPQATTPIDHIGVLGLFLMISGFSTFVFTLLIHATGVRYGRMDVFDGA
jgi:hypothetical protein